MVDSEKKVASLSSQPLSIVYLDSLIVMNFVWLNPSTFKLERFNVTYFDLDLNRLLL